MQTLSYLALATALFLISYQIWTMAALVLAFCLVLWISDHMAVDPN